MKKQILIIMALLLSFTLSAEGIKEEKIREATLDEVMTTLEEVHPHVYNKNSKEVFQAKRDEIFDNMWLQSDLEFAFSLSELVALVEDSHTSIKFGPLVQNAECIPFAFKHFGNKFHAVVLPKEYEEYLSKEVVRIDGVPINECIERLSPVISHDNEVWLYRQIEEMFTYSTILETVGIADKNKDSVTIEFSDNSEIELKKIPLSELNSQEIVRVTKGSNSITERQRKNYFYTIDGSTIYIQYNSCREDESYPFEEMINDIEDNTFDSIIIDLRNNTGGSDGVIGPLFDYLLENNTPIYCLIGRNTFSSAIINAVELDSWFNAILIGEPTGGSVNHFGATTTIELPNGIAMTISTKDINLDDFLDKGTSYGYTSLLPDFYIEETIEDYISGIDHVYEKAKELISNR